MQAASPFVVEARGTVRAEAPDLAMVRAALTVLADPEQGVQLQASPWWGFQTFKGNDPAAAARWVELNCGNAIGVYYALNPVPVALPHRVKVGDVLSRRWMLVDVDRFKTELDADHSATEGEHEDARELAGEIMAWLAEKQWPCPLLVDSGNGFHLLYRLDMPNNEHVRLLIKGSLKALADRFDGPRGSVGAECHDARRIAKLPGTWARRGVESPERPFRMARIIHCPEALEIVPAELLQALSAAEQAGIETVVEHPPGTNGTTFTVRATAEANGTGLDIWVKRAFELECAAVELAPLGNRNNALNKAAFCLGTLVGAKVLGRNEVEAALELSAHKSGLDPSEARKTVKSGLEAGILKPRELPKDHQHETQQPKIDPSEIIIVLASEVTPRKVEWLWPARIPLGKLTTFAGVGGLGKTFVLCDIAARVSRGLDWPDANGECCQRGRVLYISGEDDIDDTLVPRLIEVAADLNRVGFLTTKAQDNFTLAALGVLTQALGQLGHDTRLVVIDPPSSYLGGVDDHKNAELRGLLTPIKNWAAERRVAVIFNTHLNKAQGRIDAMMRVMGSVAWVNAVRAAHLFAKDPDDQERRFFVGMKMNLAKEKKGLAYKILDTAALARVEWLGEIDTTADQAVNRENNKPRRVVAKEWLIERFSEKLEWPSDELFRAAAQENLSRDAIFEAKRILDLPRAKRTILTNGNSVFVWWVPADWEWFEQSGQAGVSPNDCDSCPSKDEVAF